MQALPRKKMSFARGLTLLPETNGKSETRKLSVHSGKAAGVKVSEVKQLASFTDTNLQLA
jgi:hypothetical protein